MNNMTRADRYPNAPRYLGTSELGAELGVSASAVAKWLDRYPPGGDHPFPAPDVIVADSLGWSPERIDEVRSWRLGMRGRGAGGGRPRTTEERLVEQVRETIADFERARLADAVAHRPVEEAIEVALEQVAGRLGLEVEDVFKRIPHWVERIQEAAHQGYYKLALAVDEAVAYADEPLGGDQD